MNVGFLGVARGALIASAISWGMKNLIPGAAVQGRTDFGTPGYGGPCPPPGKPHHYHFRLYALKVPKLDLPADATAAFTGFNVKANSLAETEIVGLYGR